jgi:hypothetical protein
MDAGSVPGWQATILILAWLFQGILNKIIVMVAT